MYKSAIAALIAVANAAQVEHLLKDGPQQLQQMKGFTTMKPMSANSAYCMKQNGMNSALIESYSAGSPDSQAMDSMWAAMGAGIMYRGAVFVPDVNSMISVKDQINAAVADLKNSMGAWNGKLWLQVVDAEMWTGDFNLNMIYYENMVNACDATQVTCGIYSSYIDWISIFGSADYEYGNNHRLWYLNADNMANFDDYEEFGGWMSSSLWGKTYTDMEAAGSYCNVSVGLVYIPQQ